METEILTLLKDFGIYGYWGFLLYEFLDFIYVAAILSLIGYGIRLGWRPFMEFMKDTV